MPAPDGPQFKMYSARELLKKYPPNNLEHAMGESTEELLGRKLHESVESGLYGDIRQNGIRTPVSVSPRIDNPQMLDGHHRVAVMLNLSPDEVSIPVTAPPRNKGAFSERLYTDEL